MTPTRRLAAILAADVAGYSRLMGADEEGTLRTFKRFGPPPLASLTKTARVGRLVS